VAPLGRTAGGPVRPVLDIPYNNARTNFDQARARLASDLSGDPKALALLGGIEHHCYVWVGVAGVPEIRLRKAIRGAGDRMAGLLATVAGGRGKRLFDNLRSLLQQLISRLTEAGDHQGHLLVSQLRNAAVDCEAGERGFLLAGQDDFLEPYYSGRRRFSQKIGELEQKFSGDAQTKALIQRVKQSFESWVRQAATPQISMRVSYQKDPRELRVTH